MVLDLELKNLMKLIGKINGGMTCTIHQLKKWLLYQLNSLKKIRKKMIHLHNNQAMIHQIILHLKILQLYKDRN
jgi:hypothetical protein